MIGNDPRVSVDEKRKALECVLNSDTLARADQVKSFLRYVCEMEIAGRAEEISEYVVGVEALGKSAEFSTTDDTSVRNRAYVLRKKLEHFYSHEYPDAPVRIEFVKGTYIPRFVTAVAHPEHDAPPAPAPSPSRSWIRYAAVLLVGLLLGALIAWITLSRVQPATARAPVDPLLRQAWGGLLEPGGKVLICLGTAASMTLLPFDVRMEWRPEMPAFAAPKALYAWYLRHHRFFEGERLFMNPDVNSPHFGDVLGAMHIARTLQAAGVDYELLPERVVPAASIGKRNTILFGVPHKSEAVLKLLQKGAFQFKYDAATRDVVIVRTASGGQPSRTYASTRDSRDERTESFGLITVSPLESESGNAGRVLAFSGDPSAGAAAAVDYFSSPKHLAELLSRFRAEGRAQFPIAYQVLIRCKLDTNLPASFTYEAHAVQRDK